MEKTKNLDESNCAIKLIEEERRLEEIRHQH